MASDKKIIKVINDNGTWGYILFMAYIGALIYFIQQADGAFWPVILAFFQAAVWPAYVLFHVLTLIGA